VVANLRNCQLPSTITGNFVIPKRDGTIYSISGRVNVGVDLGADPSSPAAGGSQGILTVDPGVRIFGSGGLDYIVVNRGSQIFAVGTVADPVIFTSRQSIEGSTTVDSIGQWGGLVVLGRAPTSAGCPTGVTPPNIACVSQVEGTNAFYGGNTPSDNSGRLSFVRVQHSGFEILPNNELNGITLAGVGNGTTIENVQVHNSSDDGIELFGGTVNLRNIVLTGNDDDSLDVDTGWRGAVQNVLIVQRANGGDRAFEFSSAGTRTPVTGGFSLNTIPRISNATIIGRSSTSDAMVINSGNGIKLWNSIVVKTGTSACLDIDDADTITAAPTFNSVFFSCTSPFRDDGNLTETTTVFNAGANNTSAGTSSLSGTFINGTNENAVTVTTPVNHAGSTFLTAPTKIGAVSDSAVSWYKTWSCGLTGGTSC
jgi:hypothetical protein